MKIHLNLIKSIPILNYNVNKKSYVGLILTWDIERKNNKQTFDFEVPFHVLFLSFYNTFRLQ